MVIVLLFRNNMLTPIPLPADDYDRTHSTHAALSSLHAAATSFDAAMDALVQIAHQQQRRVHLLEKRTQRCREWIRKLNELVDSKSINGDGGVDDAICTVFSPGTYEEALEGIAIKIAEVRGDLDTQNTSATSASDATRTAADVAVKQALIRDANTDDGEAIPSDLWLDLASVDVNLGRSIRTTDTQRHVPLLLGALAGSSFGNCLEEKEYGAILDSLAFSSAAMNSSAANNARLGFSNTLGDDESVHSTTSKMSALTMTSTAMSTSGRLTAGQRRRWHQQQQQMRNIKAGVATTQPLENSESQILGETKPVCNTSSAATSESRLKSMPNTHNYHSNISTTKGRQQSVSGSQPYLCEVLHDSFGIGTEPKRGLVDCNGFSARGNRGGGSEFNPPLSSIDDLTIFNTTRESFGLANRRAAAAAKQHH
jgi:hypothetical protein